MLLRGQSYCCAEHRELHLDAQAAVVYERLSQSFADPPPKKLKLGQSEVTPEPAQAQPLAAAKPTEAAEKKEDAPTFEIASLAEAIESSRGSALPNGPFVPELASAPDAVALPLESDVEEPVLATVQSQAPPAQEPGFQASPSLVLGVPPAQSSVDVASIAGQATWRSVPEGYPPVIASSSATLVFDSNAAGFIPFAIGEPCQGAGPVPVLQAAAIESPLPHPQLPPWQTDRSTNPGVSVSFAPPPQALACEASWAPRQGSGYAAPPPSGMLPPQESVPRLVPPYRPQSFGALSRGPFFIAAPSTHVSPRQILSAFAHLPANIIPRNPPFNKKGPLTSPLLALASALSQRAVESTASSRAGSLAGEVASTWLQTAIAGQLPRIPTIPPSKPAGLRPSTKAVPLQWSNVTNAPPATETAAAFTTAAPLLLLSKPSSIDAPAMPRCSSAQPLRREACRLPTPVSEQQWRLSAAYLNPSLPSPWSLVRWSQSLSISIPACKPSDLRMPVPVVVRPNPGRVQALRPWSPSRRWQRLTPLLLEPNRTAWTSVALMQGSLLSPVITPISPGNEGTAPPRLTRVRVEPASMPLLPSTFEIERKTGLAPSGPSSEDNLKLECLDVAQGPSRIASEFRSEVSAALPVFSAERSAPTIALAPSSDQVSSGAIPPVSTVNKIPPFSALNRLAWSVTAYLPGGPTRLTRRGA
jgi:hypothetical protein